ncbi:MAG: hypothetical protein M3068_04455 [Gemmatimonadota bacterium]|nr:hypothetical protein [Gemmatimonadota bacterium]
MTSLSPDAVIGGRFSVASPLAGDSPALGLRSLGALTSSTVCGTPSQNPVEDTDGDHVPNDVTVSFTLPDCHFGDQLASLDITGSVRLVDPAPATPGFAMNTTLTNLRFSVVRLGTTAWVNTSGTRAVSASASGLSLSDALTITADSAGRSLGTLVDSYGATFTPASGQSLAIGQPLPNGAFVPSGGVSWSRGAISYSFSMVTTTPLQYDASCGIASGSRFSAGEVHAVITSNGKRGYLRLTWRDCAAPVALFVPA